jgi:hypothetical protein
MKRIYMTTSGAEDWRKGLAAAHHWKEGHSAHALASCWEDTDTFPAEIVHMFTDTPLRGIELLLAIPEHKVDLPGGQRPSQNDLFVLAKAPDESLVAITVEGKVKEPFDKTLGEWRAEKSEGKTERLKALQYELELSEPLPDSIRYQLIHRTASAMIEARRFGARSAVMIVHSFSQEDLWFDDYRNFLKLFGAQGGVNKLTFVHSVRGISLYCGWARGNKKYCLLPSRLTPESCLSEPASTDNWDSVCPAN